jgi:hypothetical protein
MTFGSTARTGYRRAGLVALNARRRHDNTGTLGHLQTEEVPSIVQGRPASAEHVIR